MVRTRRLQRNRSFTSLLSIVLTLAFVSVASPVHAGGGVDKLKGDIVVSTKRFPARFKSDEDMYKHMRKVNTHELTAEGEEDWKFEYMAFLPKPVATLQAAVSFYDVTTPGTQQLIDTHVFYPSDRKEKILNGSAQLAKHKYSANRKYLMVFSRGYGQRALAQTKIVLRRK